MNPPQNLECPSASRSRFPPPPKAAFFTPNSAPVCRLPPAERRGYRNVFDALLRMAREEGVATLWRVWGCRGYPEIPPSPIAPPSLSLTPPSYHVPPSQDRTEGEKGVTTVEGGPRGMWGCRGGYGGAGGGPKPPLPHCAPPPSPRAASPPWRGPWWSTPPSSPPTPNPSSSSSTPVRLGVRGGGGGASPKICDPSSYFWGFPPTQGISATISSATSAPA